MIVPRGELWTAREAEDELGLAHGTVDVWRHRGKITPAGPDRPALYWSDDLYNVQRAHRYAGRDASGRFAASQPNHNRVRFAVSR